MKRVAAVVGVTVAPSLLGPRVVPAGRRALFDIGNVVEYLRRDGKSDDEEAGDGDSDGEEQT